MYKFLLWCVSLLCIFSFQACGGDDTNDEPDNPVQNQTNNPGGNQTEDPGGNNTGNQGSSLPQESQKFVGTWDWDKGTITFFDDGTAYFYDNYNHIVHYTSPNVWGKWEYDANTQTMSTTCRSWMFEVKTFAENLGLWSGISMDPKKELHTFTKKNNHEATLWLLKHTSISATDTGGVDYPLSLNLKSTAFHDDLNIHLEGSRDYIPVIYQYTGAYNDFFYDCKYDDINDIYNLDIYRRSSYDDYHHRYDAYKIGDGTVKIHNFPNSLTGSMEVVRNVTTYAPLIEGTKVFNIKITPDFSSK